MNTDKTPCTCPSGDGSLRWPCPAHSSEAKPAPADPCLVLWQAMNEAEKYGQRTDDKLIVKFLREAGYVIAPAAPAPAWVEVTPDLLAEQHPWLYSPMWVALKSGRVCMATYEWRQGRNPDRLVGPDIGDEWAFNATHVMPVNPPEAPAIAASKGEKA